jgi:hypothetical protein
MNAPTLKVYAAGGAAINIIREVYRPEGQGKEPGFANMEITFLDTSRSNMPKGSDKDFYLVQGIGDVKVDGSGKVRGTNYDAAHMAIPEILHRHPAGDLNVIVHSASGGSGSILGPLLAQELLGQNKSVVVIMVGSTACIQEIKNTISTILSYQGISVVKNRPVVAHYLENGRRPMAENDNSVRMALLLLAAVWSGENHGLDSRDLHHFLDYQYVSQHSVALAGLKIKADGKLDEPEKGQAISSVVSIIRDGEDPDPGLVVGYHSFGRLSDAASLAIKVPTPIHLSTRQGYFACILNNLKAKLEEAESMYKVHQVNQVQVTNSNNLGIVI